MQERMSGKTAFEVTIGLLRVHAKTEISGKPLTETTRLITDQINLVKGLDQKLHVMEKTTLKAVLAKTENLTPSKNFVTTVADVRILSRNGCKILSLKSTE